MTHFAEPYANKLNELLHFTLTASNFYKQEIIEVPEVLAAILVTYDGVCDDQREINDNMLWDDFLKRMSVVKPDWIHFDLELMKRFGEKPHKVLGGWEGRTIYFIKGGRHPEQWTPTKAHEDLFALLVSASGVWGKLIQDEIENLPDSLPAGKEHFQGFEHMVRVAFNYLFYGELGEGRSQSRTDPEDEGVEIRDVIFANKSNTGFWKDLKDKYAASEIVVDAKNKLELDRDDLRQLYCYLKPALGFWGFIICRSEQPKWVHAYNRTLFRNFSQSRGVLVLCDADLRRMVQIKIQGQDPSEYLRMKMSEFTRSV